MKYAAALVVSIGIFGFASSAQSMPLAVPSESPGLVTQVRYPCGPGWHLNRTGRCVPSRHYRGERHRGHWNNRRHCWNKRIVTRDHRGHRIVRHVRTCR